MISSIKSMLYEWDFDLIGTLLECWIGLFFEMESRSLNPRQAYMKL